MFAYLKRAARGDWQGLLEMARDGRGEPAAEPRRSSGPPHAIVVGAGFGGLAAAVRLGARGYKVTVIEKLDMAGGRARVFRENGFVFDAGPTVITAPFLLRELWELAGERIEDDVTLVEVAPFYRIRFHDGTVFDYTGSAEAMRSQIAALSPRDLEGYERFLAHSERIYRVGFEALGAVPFSKPWDMARIVPDMMALESWRTVYDLVAKYIANEKLRQVLSFHPLLVGGNPFSCSSIYSLICFLEREFGVWFAMGGTGEIVRGLERLIAKQGGEIRLGTEVTEITVDEGRATGVRLSNGTSLRADVVVSNADSAWTYRHLIRPEHRSRWTDRKIDGARYSMSLFVWYFGTDRVYDDVAHHTILLGPRYRELLEDIFTKKHLAEDFSLYLHRPTATDPSMAPPGCDAFYVLSPVPHLDSGIDWREQAEPYRRSIERVLSDAVLPDLKQHVVASRVLTPRDFLSDYLSLKGAAFGLEPVLHQSAYFRPHNVSEDIDRLYLVGAGTHPGAGLPGVLSSARVLDQIVPAPEALASARRAR